MFFAATRWPEPGKTHLAGPAAQTIKELTKGSYLSAGKRIYRDNISSSSFSSTWFFKIIGCGIRRFVRLVPSVQ